MWRNIEENIAWSIKNGDLARFWNDCWISGFQSFNLVLHDRIPPQERNLIVSANASQEGWN